MVKAGDIRIHTISLPPGTYGFVYFSRKGIYHIFISQDLPIQTKREVLLHEIHHIVSDMPKFTYVIGLDMQYKKFECKANTIARERHRKYMVTR